MILTHLVVFETPTDADWSIIRQVAQEASDDPLEGLPSHMREGVRFCASRVLSGQYRAFVDYLFIGMIASQARPPGEDDATVRLRQELHSIFFSLLYGGPSI